MKILPPFLLAKTSAVLLLALLPPVGSLHAETISEALTLYDCLRESLSTNHTLLARSAESAAAGARAKGSTAARLPRLFLQGAYEPEYTNPPNLRSRDVLFHRRVRAGS